MIAVNVVVGGWVSHRGLHLILLFNGFPIVPFDAIKPVLLLECWKADLMGQSERKQAFNTKINGHFFLQIFIAKMRRYYIR